MKKYLLILTITVLTLKVGHTQTNVSGGIFSNATWTLAGSPYIVIDTVVVFPNVTLTIEPGVIVKFDNDIRLEIRQGNLIAIGTTTDSITFTSNSLSPTPGIWGNLFLNRSDASKFNYCNFRYADQGIYNDQVSNDTLVVKNSNFNDNNYGIYNWSIGSNSTNQFDTCNFMNNQIGFRTEYHQSDAIFNYCNFSFNQTGYTTSGYPNNGYLNNCIVSNNQNLGVKSAHIISNSTITNNQTGISGVQGLTNVISCTVRNNTDGIWGADTVDYCTINNNQYGVNATNIMNSTIDSNSVNGVNYRGSVFNCLIRENGIGIYLADSFYVVTKNQVENNDIGIELEVTGNTIFCNKICNNTTYDLRYTNSSSETVADNYWCTPDSASTTLVIYDGYDNINYGLINFMPLDTLNCYSITGISNPTLSNLNIRIYPNPTSGKFRVESLELGVETIEIYDLFGRLVYQQRVTSNQQLVDMSSYPAGLYIWRVGEARGKIILE